jgi:hypothetical protein
VGGQTISIHPGSSMFGKRVEAIMYNELVSRARGSVVIRLEYPCGKVGEGKKPCAGGGGLPIFFKLVLIYFGGKNN